MVGAGKESESLLASYQSITFLLLVFYAMNSEEKFELLIY